MTIASGITFADCYPNRLDVAIDGLERPVPFIGLDDLLTNKAESARPQDLADVDALSQE